MRNFSFLGKKRIHSAISFGLLWGLVMLMFDLAIEWVLGNSFEWMQLLWQIPLWLCAGLVLGMILQATGIGIKDNSKSKSLR